MSGFVLNGLDQSAITTNGTAKQAVEETVAVAQTLDELGFHRFWLAEHHNTSAFAGAAPEILIGHIAAQTQHIRVGSGGIMLPHYSPMKVAEQFRMLASLHAGRIDLGLGRAPGGDARTAAALQAGPQAWPVEVFPQQVEMLVQFLEDANGLSGDNGGFPDDHPYQGIHAQPMGQEQVPVFILGSGGDGAVHAAQMGLPYVYAHFINPENVGEATKLYKDLFRPSRHLAAPKLILATSVLVADSEEEAAYLARPRNVWATQLMQNKAGRFPSLQEAQDWQPAAAESALFEMVSGRSATGTPEQVMTRLNGLVRDYGFDEVIALTLIPDLAARQKSYRLLAQAAGLAPAKAA